MDHEDPVPVDVPGVTFWVEASGITGITVDGKKTGYVKLLTEISDEEIWKEVLKRLDGFRVHAIDDFHSQILMALRIENEELTKELAKVTEQKRVAEERFQQAVIRARLLDEDNQRLRGDVRAAETSAAVRDLELLLQKKS